MPDVKMSIGEVGVLNEQTAPRFVVHDKGQKLGELRVSKGGIRWLSKGLQEDAFYTTWKKFDEWMRTQPRR
jgi:hypothetical protein